MKTNTPGCDPQQRVLFQAAVGRSGSTILRHSIGMHPQIYYNGMENNLIQDVADVAHRNCTLASRVYAMKVDQATYDDAFRELITKLIWPGRQLAQRPLHYAAINPSGENLDYLRQVFPQMKVVGLVRNGLEVICSRTKYESFSHLEFTSHCQTWLKSTAVLDWGDRNPDRFFLFRHEWTHDAKLLESKLRELFQWAGIDWSPLPLNNMTNVLDCSPTTDAPKPFSEMSTQEKEGYFAAKAAGAKQWTVEQRREFVERCGGLMKRLGYALPVDFV